MLGKTQCIVINCCQFFVGLFLNKHSKEVVIGEKEMYLFIFFKRLGKVFATLSRTELASRLLFLFKE